MNAEKKHIENRYLGLRQKRKHIQEHNYQNNLGQSINGFSNAYALG